MLYERLRSIHESPFGPFGGKGKASIVDAPTSGAAAPEMKRVLIGEPSQLKFGTKVKVSALLGETLEAVTIVHIADKVTLGDTKQVVGISTPGEVGSAYLLQPDRDVMLDPKNRQALTEAIKDAARKFIDDYSALDRATNSMRNILGLQFEVVEPAPTRE
jgi:hypothetical protein